MSTKKTSQDQNSICIEMSPANDGLEMKITPSEKTHHIKKNNDSYILVDEENEPVSTYLSFNKEKIVNWIKEGKLDKEIGQIIIEAFDQQEHLVNLSKEIETSDIIKEMMMKNSEKIPKQVDAVRHLLSIKDQLNVDRISTLFKKNIDPEKSFGVTKALMDRLNYLPELLSNSVLNVSGNGSNLYTISSTLQQKSDSGVGSIGLEHLLLYEKDTSPEKAFDNYIDIMQTDALRVFLAYWAYANEQESFHYQTSITEIMTLLAPERESYFTTKEKERFWHLSRLLENTYLTITIKHQKKLITVRHPLLSFSGTISTEKNNKKIDTYPSNIIARVLNPDNFKDTANLATQISKKTLDMKSEDILCALTLMIRSSQRRDGDTLSFDEKYLIDRSRLQKTNNANPRMARKRLKEKLDRIQKAEAIKSWDKSKNGQYSIKITKKQTKVETEKI